MAERGGEQESTGYWNFPCGNIRESSPGTVSLEVGPATGNLMYMMPQKGPRVSLYFKGDEETDAIAVNCIRSGEGSQVPTTGTKAW